MGVFRPNFGFFEIKRAFFSNLNYMDKRFLLCFHDFSVCNFQTVMPVLQKISELAGRPCSVLVIPCTEGANESTICAFKQALMYLHNEGYELALHGFKHKAEFSQGRSYAGLLGMNVTGGEAEFAGLSESESSRLLQLGIAAWNKVMENGQDNHPLKPAAFVPPTWYSNKFLPCQVRSEGMLYESRFCLTTSKGGRYFSPVASFAGIPRSFENTAVSLGSKILKLPFGLPRLALHPSDFPRLENDICNLIRVALGADRKMAHYCEL